jgi:glutaredoxin
MVREARDRDRDGAGGHQPATELRGHAGLRHLLQGRSARVTVVVYTKKPCVQCDATIRRIESKGVTPVLIRVDDEAGAPILKELVDEGYQQAPIVKIYDEEAREILAEWSGFIPALIDEHVRAA